MRFVITLLATLVVLTGCGKSSGGAAVPRTTAVTEQQAIDFAKAAVAERTPAIAKTATYVAKAQGNGWAIAVEAAQDNLMILLDGEGKVVSYVTDKD